MDKLQAFLQVSAKLYQHLTDMPKDDLRDNYIEIIHQLLDERQQCIDLIKDSFVYNSEDKMHQILLELDLGINERLNSSKKIIQLEMKQIQASKKNEKHYINPYSDVQVMDGKYYDKKN